MNNHHLDLSHKDDVVKNTLLQYKVKVQWSDIYHRYSGYGLKGKYIGS